MSPNEMNCGCGIKGRLETEALRRLCVLIGCSVDCNGIAILDCVVCETPIAHMAVDHSEFQGTPRAPDNFRGNRTDIDMDKPVIHNSGQ